LSAPPIGDDGGTVLTQIIARTWQGGSYLAAVTRFTPDERIRAGWLKGELLREIAAATGLSVPRVSVRAKELGLPSRSPRIASQERERFVQWYAEGASLRAIAARAQRHVNTVRNALVAASVTLRGCDQTRVWPVDHGAFQSPLSAEALYWLGFVAADGSVSGSKVVLVQRNGCEDVLRRFLAFVGSETRPLIPSSNRRAKHAVVSSPRIAADLAAHGILPRKSWSLRVSDEVASHAAFWLGMLDGDGCVNLSAGGVPEIIYLGTREVMEQCAVFIATVLDGRRPAVICAGKSSAVLCSGPTRQASKERESSSSAQLSTKARGLALGTRANASVTSVARRSNAIRRSCVHRTPFAAVGILASGSPVTLAIRRTSEVRTSCV
jgi:hypothetical protein